MNREQYEEYIDDVEGKAQELYAPPPPAPPQA